MSYFTFHLIFTLPPILLLLLVQRQPLAGMGGQRPWLGLPLIALLALVYTTPWDNYLIGRGVWVYGAGRIVGAIGYVPVEEYLFFLLQPMLTGLWLYWVLAHLDVPSKQEYSTIVQAFTIGFWMVLSIAGALMLQWDTSVYLGLLLAWAGPILALQWLVGAKQLWATKRIWLMGTLIPTLYLWLCDRVAIGQGIWSISDKYTTGLQLFSLPIEEAIFFLVTNLLIVQGLLVILLLGKIER